MTKDQKAFTEVLFDYGEEVYASPDKYSSKWDEEKQEWIIYRPSVLMEEIPDDTNLVGLNPIKGLKRNDESVTAFRSFLVEIDNLPLKQQKELIEKSGLPYSVCVFSGGKSLHFGITLDEDLPSLEVYRFYSEWILNSIPEADGSTKNPSRGIRYPDVTRWDKGKKQRLVEVKGRISLNKLKQYLSKHQDKVPKPQTYSDTEYKEKNKTALADWVVFGFKEGFDFSIGRNNRWFAIGVEFAKCGYSFDSMVSALERVFVEEKSFERKEWLAALKSGYFHGNKKYRGNNG